MWKLLLKYFHTADVDKCVLREECTKLPHQSPAGAEVGLAHKSRPDHVQIKLSLYPSWSHHAVRRSSATHFQSGHFIKVSGQLRSAGLYLPYLWIAGWVCPWVRINTLEKRKSSYLLPEVKPLFLGCPVCNPVTVPTALFTGLKHILK
jgi:hypothetical protein